MGNTTTDSQDVLLVEESRFSKPLPKRVLQGILARLKHYVSNCVDRMLPRWAQKRKFLPTWKARIEAMAFYIHPGESILDLGCGMQWLKQMLPDDTTYYGCDLFRRDEKTIVCDFNKYQFPEVQVDVIFISGTMEYIHDWQWFLTQASQRARKLIVSYCTQEDYPDVDERFHNHQWVNTLSRTELLTFLTELGFSIEDIIDRAKDGTIIVAVKCR